MENIILLVAVLAHLGIGLFTLSRNQKSYTVRFFALFVLISAVWAVVNHFSLRAETPQATLNLIRWVMFLGVLHSLSLFLTIHTFPSDRIRLRPPPLILLILVNTIVLLLTRTPLIFSDISGSGISAQPVPGPAIPLFALVTGFNIIGSIVTLVIRYRHAGGIEKAQFRYLIAGILGSALLIFLTNFVVVVLYKNNAFLIFGPTYTLIFIAATAYAIIDKQLFNIKVFATQTLVFLILFALFVDLAISSAALTAVVRGLILLFVGYGGFELIKSVRAEIKRREEVARLAEQLKVANEHLKELDKMKSEFVSLASHELLTPISAIQGYLSMILDEKIVEHGAEEHRYLRRVADSAKRLGKLVADLLNVSRIEQGRLLVEKTEVDITKIIEAVLAQLKFKAEAKQLRLNWDRQPSPAIFADPEKVEEVLINLVGNSIKYTEKGGLTITAESVVTSKIESLEAARIQSLKQTADQESLAEHIEPERRTLVGAEQLVVSVADTGIGIEPSKIPSLFKKFYRTETGSFEGNGLGLYISKSLVEMMHGRMWATSRGLGKGATFAFSLPLASATAEIQTLEKKLKVTKTAKPLARIMG